MACGCVAQGHVTGTNEAVCVIHDEHRLMVTEPDLTGRTAKCCYCRKTQPSSKDLPFFEFRGTSDRDGYYCGCRGWD